MKKKIIFAANLAMCLAASTTLLTQSVSAEKFQEEEVAIIIPKSPISGSIRISA